MRSGARLWLIVAGISENVRVISRLEIGAASRKRELFVAE